MMIVTPVSTDYDEDGDGDESPSTLALVTLTRDSIKGRRRWPPHPLACIPALTLALW